jgi:sugar lactone lactonase YvrE
MAPMKRTCIAQLVTGLAVCLSPQIVTVVADILFVGDQTAGNIYEYNTAVGASSQTTFASGLATPAGLAFDGQGNLYASLNADSVSNGNITKFAPNGTPTQVANPLNTPGELAFDSSGNLKVGAQGNMAVYSVNVNSGAVSTFVTLGPGSDVIHGLAYDSSGVLYVANALNGGSVSEYNPDGSFKGPLANSIDGPSGVAIAPSGKIYVASANNGYIYSFNPDGSGQTTVAFGLSTPVGLAFDSAGNLFVAEAGAGRVDEIGPSGIVSVFASGLSGPWALAFEPVPEPSTWALLGLGVGMVTLGLRKGRS